MSNGKAESNGSAGSGPSRRQVLEGGMAAAVWLGAACERRRSRALAAGGNGTAAPSLEVSLRAARAEARLDPERRSPTEIRQFQGKLLGGRSDGLLSRRPR